MDIWTLLYFCDITLFCLISFTVIYMTIFTLAAMLPKRHYTQKVKHQNRFIILIPSYRNSNVEQTVASALGQSYPQRLFDITVISDHNNEMTNFHLAQQPITLLTPNFRESNKAKYFQLAISNLPQFKLYDVVIILEAGNIIESDFLEKINTAYENAGTRALQAHRVSRNSKSQVSQMAAIFEEINNTIFRKGHNRLGLSASLCMSGMAFDFEWFKSTILQFKANWDDKNLESILLQQHVFVEYVEDLYVYDEKPQHAEDFNRQRGQWIKSQFVTLLKNIHHLPWAILTRQYDLADKIIQWMLMPRMVLMGLVVIMSAILPFIYMSLALKWWALFAFVLFIFALATPDYLVDENWSRSSLKSPLILMRSIPGLSKIADFIDYLDKKFHHTKR